MVPALVKDFIGYSGMNNRDLERTRMALLRGGLGLLIG